MDRVESKVDIDAVFAPSRYVLYLMDNCSGPAVRNRHLKRGNEEDKQPAAIISILCNLCRRRITPTRVPLKRPCNFQATIAEKKQTLKTNFCVLFDCIINILLSIDFCLLFNQTNKIAILE